LYNTESSNSNHGIHYMFIKVHAIFYKNDGQQLFIDDVQYYMYNITMLSIICIAIFKRGGI